ncbi:unnamed protein product [Linum trigynum]|uniref:Uncharacterized protein n=1 Tax=Linum trigynum TaxID=586398 RepID=A0AAV2FJL6_9ROSI
MVDSVRSYSSTTIKSIHGQFGQISSGSILGRLERGTITDFGRFFRNDIFFLFWRLQITDLARGYSPPIIKSIGPILRR